ncbi:MAG: hypothetical protein B7Y45_03530 [Sphingomonas sp. 28-66-16]|nr:MAG: hypothetical protein B7Y45_03530 [Sphingomonas sp. 28-66-16]
MSNLSVTGAIVWLSGLMAVAGCGYIVATTVIVARFGSALRGARPTTPAEPVTVLKPLHGSEPRLRANLATFLEQDWAAPIQLVAGVHSAQDKAIAAVNRLAPGTTSRAVGLVVDGRRHGANAKIGNLINMMPSAAHDIIVLSDSDIAVTPAYLARVGGALAEPGVGAVTCLYRGRGDNGFWSQLGGAAISYRFLPSVLVSRALDAGAACMGSTIALRRETLDRIGGFERFADILADDHAIGEAVRALGLQVVIAPYVVTHASTEPSLAALFRHELRWGATVRDINPAGYAGLIVTMPLPFALLVLALAPGLAAGVLAGLTLALPILLKRAVDRLVGASTAPLWQMPLRECLSFVVFVTSFFVRTVDWQGARLDMAPEGKIKAATSLGQ